MSLKDCIARSHAAGEITLEERQELEKRLGQLTRQILAPAEIKKALAAEIEAEAFERQRRALLTEQARQRVDSELDAHRDGKGRADPAEALELMLEHHGQGRMQDTEHRRLAILAGAHAKLDTLLYEMRKGWARGDKRRLYGRTRARLENVVRELFGEGTGDDLAAQMARAWSDVAEDMRQRFNAAGGAIGHLEKWGLPQHNNGEALLAAGREAWVDYVMPMLDRDRMLHPLTKRVMGDEELQDSLRHVWDTITTEGWIDREATGANFGKGALFRQHADHRFLVFKDADAWLKYQQDFGEGDPFAAMMGHISTMARDIAFLEQFGPNPEAMFNYLKQRVLKAAHTVKPRAAVIDEKTAQMKALTAELGKAPGRDVEIVDRIGAIHRELDALRSKTAHGATKRGKKKMEPLHRELLELEHELSAYVLDGNIAPTVRQAELQAEISAVLDDLNGLEEVPFPTDNPLDRARKDIARAEAKWGVMRGSVNTPVSARMANWSDVARNWVISSSLGSAQLSAFSDVGFQKVARTFTGLPATTVIRDLVSAFGKENRREAVRSWLIAENALHVMHTQSRYLGSVNTKMISGYLADRVIHMQGLAAWTQAGKHAFGLAFQGELAARAGVAFDKLPDALRLTLERHGFTPAEWDVMRRVQLYEPRAGATFLRPNEIAGVDRALAEKYIAMIMRETKYAVPEATVGSRVVLTQGVRPGTLVGEIIRNFALFKSFGVSVAMLQASRVAREVGAGRGARGALYGGALLITSGLLGGLAMQLKALAAGQDPRDMTDPAFWGAALLQGGGLGIYGDFLFGNVNRLGGGLSGTVAGPVVDRMSGLRDLTVGNVVQLGEEKTNFGRELTKFLKQNTPGGNLWYLRLAGERLVFDQLQHLLDPDARAAFRRRASQRKKQFGNEFWWAPGETAPRRAPDPARALGGR